MNVIDAISTRRSVRQFTAQPVSDDDLHTILAAGMSGPSADSSIYRRALCLIQSLPLGTRMNRKRIYPLAEDMRITGYILKSGSDRSEQAGRVNPYQSPKLMQLGS